MLEVPARAPQQGSCAYLSKAGWRHLPRRPFGRRRRILQHSKRGKLSAAIALVAYLENEGAVESMRMREDGGLELELELDTINAAP